MHPHSPCEIQMMGFESDGCRLGSTFRGNLNSERQSEDSQNRSVVAQVNSGILRVHRSGMAHRRASPDAAFAENYRSMGAEAKPAMKEEDFRSDDTQMTREFLPNDDQITPPLQQRTSLRIGPGQSN